MANGGSDTIKVLLSVPPPRQTTNPYAVMLSRALAQTPGLEVAHFSWREALTGDYDVFHVHWPEALPAGRGMARTAGRHGALGALIARLKVTRTPVVRTLHNIKPHQEVPPATAALLAALDRRTRVAIRLNPLTQSLPGVPVVTIPLGHYKSWYDTSAAVPAQAGVLASIGLIRRYKGLEALIAAFVGVPDPAASLQIAGIPADQELADQLVALAASDPRITVDPRFISDDELVALVTGAELVVLPYSQLHNSAAALTALSLDRPVLVPGNAVTDDLAQEVGQQWVQRFDGDFTTESLVAAMAAVAGLARSGTSPQLATRDWDRVGQAHLEAYRMALAGPAGP